MHVSLPSLDLHLQLRTNPLELSRPLLQVSETIYFEIKYVRLLPMETVSPAGLRLLSVSRVAPAPVDNCSNVKAKLSFLDVPWVATPPVQQVFLYEKGGGAEYGGMVKRLKESLAASLALYLPLAGKLAYVQETGDIVVDCSDPGVAFIEAEAMADLSRRLASDGDNVPAASLVPEHDARVLPAPVMVVQATRLNGGGLAVGLSAHHAAVDGRAFVLFMDAWSSMSRSRGGASPVTVTVTNKPLSRRPNYSREALVHPSSNELTHEVLSKIAPNLPLANAMAEDDYKRQHYRLRHRTFLLGADDIRTLKQHIDGLGAGSGDCNKPVSTFVAVVALSWAAFVRAKGLAAGEDTHLVFQIDLRARIQPPVGACYIGNCVRGCIASADAGELVGDGDMGLLRASRAIQAAIKEAEETPLDRIGKWMERLISLPAARLANVGGSPLFRVYQTANFGFGMPDKVVPLSMPGSPDTTTTCYPGFGRSGQSSLSTKHDRGGRIVLSGGKRRGEVCLSASLHPVLMDAFNNNINSIPTRSRL